MQLRMEMDLLTQTVFIVVLIIEAIAVYYFTKYYKLRRLVSSTETSAISDLSDGFREIEGRIISLGQPLISPYSEKACVYYDLLVEERRSIGRNPYGKNDGKPQWDELINDGKMLRFGVDDGSGIAVVDLKHASIELKSDDEFNPDLNRDMKLMSYANQERVLKRYGMEGHEGTRARTLRFRELLLEEGIQVYVMGEVRRNADGQPFFGVQGKPLYVSDHSEDGLLNLYENKLVFSVVVMISIPLGLLLFWLEIVMGFQL